MRAFRTQLDCGEFNVTIVANATEARLLRAALDNMADTVMPPNLQATVRSLITPLHDALATLPGAGRVIDSGGAQEYVGNGQGQASLGAIAQRGGTAENLAGLHRQRD